MIQKRSFLLTLHQQAEPQKLSSPLYIWSPRKRVRSEMITDTIRTYKFSHGKYENIFGFNTSVGGISKQDPNIVIISHGAIVHTGSF